MNRVIIGALIGCVVVSAVGGFGAPVLCQGVSDIKACAELWKNASTGALAAANALGMFLANQPTNREP